jgi:SSS family transporter
VIEAIADNLRTYWPVHLMLAVYTALLAFHAWQGGRSTRTVSDFYVGGRRMGGVAIGLSFFATYSSTNSFVGFAGQSYTWGIVWLLLVPFIVGMSLFSWVAVAPRLRRFTESLDSLTIPDFIGFRYGSTPARVAAAVIVIFASAFYMTAVFKGIGNLLEAFLDIPYRIAIVIVFFIVMAYTMVGGFISVVKTDVVQGMIMIVAAVILAWGTVEAAGGIGALNELRADAATAHLFDWSGGVAFAVALGVIFSGTVKFAVEPRQLSRFYALESVAAVRTGAWVSTVSFALVYALLVPLGLYARRLFPDGITETDAVVPAILTSSGAFSPGTAAFLLVAMVAAAMSSLDSVLLVTAATADRDIVRVFRRRPTDERAIVRSTRAYVALFAAITAAIALEPPGGIVALTSFSGALYGACFAPAILLGLYWRRGNGVAVLTSFTVGIAVLLGWRYLPWRASLHEVFPALALSLTAFVVVAMRTGISANVTLDRLFGEVDTSTRPGPRAATPRVNRV